MHHAGHCNHKPQTKTEIEKMKQTSLPRPTFLWLLLVCLCNSSSAFLPTPPARTCQSIPLTRCYYHPAVEGWEQKYVDEGGTDATAPRKISDEFEVHAATESELVDLDVEHWPTWTTGDKEKWAVGNQVPDKEMPYGELSYVITGKLEIIPQSTGVPVIISVGDFVTFPKGFVASWKVLEELTWNYYLY